MHGIKVLMAKNYVDNLSEEVKKGLREKAEQGHWPTVAPRRVRQQPRDPSHRRGSGAGTARRPVFELYASGDYSLLALQRRARAIGLTHWRAQPTPDEIPAASDAAEPDLYRRVSVAGISCYQGSHTPLITRATFDRVQAVLAGKGKGHGRYVKQRHPFMGLLTCARCGCAMTAELKKGRYVYYRCTGFKGRCGNTYIRQETLAALLGTTVHAIQIPTQVADQIAAALRDTDGQVERERREARQRLEQRRRTIIANADRAYDDLGKRPNFRGLLDPQVQQSGKTSAASWRPNSRASSTPMGVWRSPARRF